MGELFPRKCHVQQFAHVHNAIQFKREYKLQCIVINSSRHKHESSVVEIHRSTYLQTVGEKSIFDSSYHDVLCIHMTQMFQLH